MLPKKIALICGGPSPERGISLNSARSVMDHLMDVFDVVPFYVDLDKQFYQLDPALLYSNTPSDFDFKLHAEGDSKSIKLSMTELIAALKTCDLVFPAIHGDFGETGELQALLEKHQIPFVGCGSEACRNMYYKDRAAAVLKQAGFDTLVSITVKPPLVILDKGDVGALDRGPINYITDEVIVNGSSVCGATHLAEDDKIKAFFTTHNITRAIVKPIAGGSSIGVHSVTSAEQAIDIVSKATAPMIIEPFCEGREFTIIVLESKKIRSKALQRNGSSVCGALRLAEDDGQNCVALVPTEIQISYEGGAIFDYRRKYLPTSNTVWACPPNFSDEVIQKIRSDAEAIFRLFGMRDFARLDGWVLDDGRIIFTDMNPISGMEQNSFIFQQTSRMGMTHQEALMYVISR